MSFRLATAKRVAAAMQPRVVLLAVLLATALSAALASLPGAAAELRLLPPVLGTSEVYAADPRSGLALSGLDPVSYFAGAPRAGSPGRELVWSGLGWRFASAANAAAFTDAPEAYLPRLGGYDAVAAAEGLVVDVDPRVFAIRDGRLYLFRNAERRERFLLRPDLAAAAERNWPGLRATLVQG